MQGSKLLKHGGSLAKSILEFDASAKSSQEIFYQFPSQKNFEIDF